MNGGRGYLDTSPGTPGSPAAEEAGRNLPWSFRGGEAPWTPGVLASRAERISSCCREPPVCGDLLPLPQDANTCPCVHLARLVPSWLVSMETGEAESEHLCVSHHSLVHLRAYFGGSYQQLTSGQRAARSGLGGQGEEGGRGAGK